MKRTYPFILLLVLVSFFAAAQSRRRQPQPVALKELRLERIFVHYVPNLYLSAHVRDLAARAQTNLREAETLLRFQLREPLQLYLFGDWEEKGNYTNDVRLAHADPDTASVYCIVNDSWDGLAERMEFQVLLRNGHGPAFDRQWEEYAASGLAGVWFQRKLDDWQIFLKTRGLLPQFPALFKDQQISRFIRHPWNASLIRFIHDQYGMPAMLHFYKTGELPQDFAGRWGNNVSDIPVKSREPYAFKQEFQRGMSYAYWNSYDAGYATKKSQQSLKELQTLGVNWIASIPYGFMRSNQALEIHFPRHHIAGENDESLWALAEDARRLNMKVMLKPQIWIGHSSWPGNIEFESPEEWNLWMDNYEKWIVHYAIIAELTDASLFCVGTELVEATLNNPTRWRSIIEKIRNVYSGPLTYASNWGREFEGIRFWDDLDYIGLDNYYSVRDSEIHGERDLKQAFAQQKKKLRETAFRYCRPLLFTEIGYMANNKAGMGQKEFEADESDYDESMQEMCYRLALETYWDESWFAGMYWWKWFSEPDDRGRTADEHSPHGRSAERTLSRWYRNKQRD